VVARGGGGRGGAGETDVEVQAERLVAVRVGADHRQHEREDPGAPGAQAPRRGVGPVADPLRRVEHALAGARIDPALPVEGMRDRRERHAGHGGDVADGGAFAGGHGAEA
jgi:hypothetical protein